MTMSPLNAVATLCSRETRRPKVTSPAAAVLIVRSGSPSLDAFSRAQAGDFTTSLRIPVHKSNRQYLRALRAAELAAWEKADRNASRAADPAPAASRLPLAPEDLGSRRCEALCYGFLVAAAVLALVVNAGAGLSLVASWQRIEELVRATLL
jgi:hypothetical protein